MKISKLFHWLYCAVMFLPLFVLPIFALAVRSDNNYQPIEVQVEENLVVEHFNQFFNGDLIYSSANSVEFSFDNDLLNITGTSYSANPSWAVFYSFDIIPSHRYLISCIGDYFSSSESQSRVAFLNNTWTTLFSLNNENTYVFHNAVDDFVRVAVGPNSGVTYDMHLYLQIFDLTEMGFETITYPLFKAYFPNDFYDFSASTNVIIPNQIVTYSYTDFGSQTIYTLYKEVDDYFNYDNVLNIGELYEWCEINLFNGNATLGFFIFFHLLEYWLLTSLLWLIFDILMYVPQLCHRWLDKASLE